MLERLRECQVIEIKKELGVQILNEKNKEFMLIESICYLKLLDCYFKANTESQKQLCIEKIKQYIQNSNTIIQVNAEN